MRLWNVMLILGLVVAILTGCGGDAVPSGEQGNPTQGLTTGSYTSATLGTAYEDALPATSQLALGILQLEGTGNAITPEQAKTLLPLWRMLEGSSLLSDAERNAVLKQVEGGMTAEQLAAIAARRLTFEDLGRWMREHGESFTPPSGAMAGSGGFALPNGVNEDEMAAMRATAQAGGGMPSGGGPFGEMSEEERAAMRATAEAGGMVSGGRGPAGANSDQLVTMAAKVVELLSVQVAE